MGLRGKVQSLQVKKYKGVDSLGTFFLVSLEEHKQLFFNKEGNKSKVLIYKGNDSICTRTIYKYDEEGTLFEDFCYNRYNKIINRSKYHYKDRRIERVCYAENGDIIGRDVYKYDSLRNLVFETKSNYGVAESNKGKPTLVYNHYNRGNIIFVFRYQNVSPCQFLECEESISKDLIAAKCKYDSIGNLIEVKFGEAKNDFFSKYSFQYDAQGMWVGMLFYDKKGDVIGRRKFQYNYQKDITKIFDEDEGPQHSIRTEYQYDDEGNYLQKIVYEVQSNIRQKKNVTIELRTIKYYD